MSREVDARQLELTHQVHREILMRSMEEVKTLTPILICSMKIYIQIHSEGELRILTFFSIFLSLNLNVNPSPIYLLIYSVYCIWVGGRGGEEAGVNRDYLAQRMSDEINEIIRVLQLTTYDEDEWDADNLTGMKRALTVIDSKMQAAHDWLGVSPPHKYNHTTN